MKQCEVFGPEMNTNHIDAAQWQQAFTLPPDLALDRVWGRANTKSVKPCFTKPLVWTSMH